MTFSHRQKSSALLAIACLLFLGVGLTVMMTAKGTTPKGKSHASPTRTATTVKATDTVEGSLGKVGMTCSGSTTSKECTWQSKKFSLLQPKNWSADQKTRDQACEQGYINSNYHVLTDGKTWYVTTDYDEDLTTLSSALPPTMVHNIGNYCEN